MRKFPLRVLTNVLAIVAVAIVADVMQWAYPEGGDGR